MPIGSPKFMTIQVLLRPILVSAQPICESDIRPAIMTTHFSFFFFPNQERHFASKKGRLDSSKKKAVSEETDSDAESDSDSDDDVPAGKRVCSLFLKWV